MNLISRYIFALSTLVASLSVDAGFPSGPYLVWVNLHESSSGYVTESIKQYMQSDRDGLFCDKNSIGPIVYIKNRPEGITNSLVFDALVNKNKESIAELQRNLLIFRSMPDIRDGLDGVVAYSEIGGPSIIGLGAKSGRLRISKIRKSLTYDSVIEAFCTAVPPIWRN